MLAANPAILNLFRPDETGNVLAASNREFLGAFINATVELASPQHPAGQAVMAHKTRCRRYFRALAEAADVEDPDAISDQWMLLTEGATITALVEGDRAAAHKARAGADAILRTLQAAA